MINIADIDRAVFSNRDVMATIDLPIIIAEATPFGDDFAGEIDFKKLATIGRRGFQVAAINDIEQIVAPDRKGPRTAQIRGLPLFQEFSIRIENLNARITAIGNVKVALRIDRYAMRQVKFTRTLAFVPQSNKNLPSDENFATRLLP